MGECPTIDSRGGVAVCIEIPCCNSVKDERIEASEADIIIRTGEDEGADSSDTGAGSASDVGVKISQGWVVNKTGGRADGVTVFGVAGERLVSTSAGRPAGVRGRVDAGTGVRRLRGCTFIL